MRNPLALWCYAQGICQREGGVSGGESLLCQSHRILILTTTAPAVSHHNPPTAHSHRTPHYWQTHTHFTKIDSPPHPTLPLDPSHTQPIHPITPRITHLTHSPHHPTHHTLNPSTLSPTHHTLNPCTPSPHASHTY